MEYMVALISFKDNTLPMYKYIHNIYMWWLIAVAWVYDAQQVSIDHACKIFLNYGCVRVCVRVNEVELWTIYEYVDVNT